MLVDTLKSLVFSFLFYFRSEQDARMHATEAGVSPDVKLERDPDVLDTWFR